MQHEAAVRYLQGWIDNRVNNAIKANKRSIERRLERNKLAKEDVIDLEADDNDKDTDVGKAVSYLYVSLYLS